MISQLVLAHSSGTLLDRTSGPSGRRSLHTHDHVSPNPFNPSHTTSPSTESVEAQTLLPTPLPTVTPTLLLSLPTHSLLRENTLKPDLPPPPSFAACGRVFFTHSAFAWSISLDFSSNSCCAAAFWSRVEMADWCEKP